MKLRNKKTGEIDDVSIVHSANKIKGVVEHEDGVQCLFAYTLEEFNEEWEDYEESKGKWFISNNGQIHNDEEHERFREERKQIGNYFETKEEAEKAVEKLKAWKRLKDKGFRFTGFTHKDRGRLDELEIYCQLGECPEDIEDMEDVRLLFGGEE